MPRYEEVTQRTGSLGALTGLHERRIPTILPHFEQAFVTYMQDRTIDGGNPARVSGIVPMTPVRCPHWRTNGSSC